MIPCSGGSRLPFLRDVSLCLTRKLCQDDTDFFVGSVVFFRLGDVEVVVALLVAGNRKAHGDTRLQLALVLERFTVLRSNKGQRYQYCTGNESKNVHHWYCHSARSERKHVCRNHEKKKWFTPGAKCWTTVSRQ